MNDFNFVIVDIVNNVIPSTESAIVLSNSFFQVAQLVSVSCSTRRAELPNSRFVCGENRGRREENGKNHSIPFPYYGMRLRRIADLCHVIIKK